MEGPFDMPTKLFIASPMYGGQCSGPFTVGMISASNVLNKAGIPFTFSYLMNESLITRARNRLVHDFMRTDCSHLLFIDADIGFDANKILSMLEADKEILCGVYPKKEINWPLVEAAVKGGATAADLPHFSGSFVINPIGGSTTASFQLDRPLEIDHGGTGFMLVKREVFLRLASAVPQYTHDLQLPGESSAEPLLIHEFFSTSIDAESNRLLSEDYHFCKLARHHGFRVWAAPWINLVHCGTYMFNGMIPRA